MILYYMILILKYSGMDINFMHCQVFYTIALIKLLKEHHHSPLIKMVLVNEYFHFFSYCYCVCYCCWSSKGEQTTP